MLWLLFGFLALLTLIILAWLRNSVLVGQNEALIITGRRYHDLRGNERNHRIVKRGTAFVWPYTEQYMRISLEPWTLHLNLYALDGAMMVDARARIRLNPDSQSIYQAIELGFADTPDQAEQTIIALFQQHFSTLLESFSLAEAVDTRKQWIKRYQRKMHTALAEHGLTLVWLDLYKLVDSQGYMQVIEAHERSHAQHAQAKAQKAAKKVRLEDPMAALAPAHQAAQELLKQHPELIQQFKPDELDKPFVQQALIQSTDATPEVIEALLEQLRIKHQLNHTEYLARAAFELLEMYPELVDIMTPANFKSHSFRRDVVEATGSTPEVIEMVYSQLLKRQPASKR